MRGSAPLATPPLERIPRDRTPSLELVRITEAAAIAASHWMGQGDNNAADQAAVEAMRRSMEDARFNGRIVIGEGERDEAPMLYIGEKVGRGDGPEVDIAVDPLEGTTPTAKGRPNAVAVMAFSEPGGLLHAPDTYMEKLAVGAPAKGKVDLDRPVAENLRIIAQSLNRDVSDLTVVILDRPRHERLIAGAQGGGTDQAHRGRRPDGRAFCRDRGHRRPRAHGDRRGAGRSARGRRASVCGRGVARSSQV